MTKYENKTTLTIPVFLCDRYGELPLSTLTKMMVDVSGRHTDKINDGAINDYMEKHNLSWIILQYHIDITRSPRNGEKITIITYADGYNRLFCYRNFEIFSEEGDLLAKAEMTFAWMDIEKRKLVSLDSQVMDVFGAPYEKRIRRLATPRALDETASNLIKEHFKIYYSDIDVNNHVNNSVYIKWTIDSLGIDFLNSHQINSFNIKYEKEILQGEDVQVLTSIDKNEETRTFHKIQVDNQTNATVEVIWRKKKSNQA